MDKLEQFFMKEPGKLDKVVSAIVCIALFIAYRVGIATGALWTYILLLFLSVLVLVVFSKEKEVFIKICAIINILYSLVSLIQPDLVERWFAVAFVGRLFSVAFGIFVAFFGLLLGAFWRLIIWVIIYGTYCLFTKHKRRKIPQTKSLVRKDKWIYLQEDYDSKKTVLIYRKGRKKRILDTYPWESAGKRPYFAIKWNGEKSVTVEKYSRLSLKKEEEKNYEIKN